MKIGAKLATQQDESGKPKKLTLKTFFLKNSPEF